MHQALAFSRRTGLPPVATTRAHFVDPRQFPVHRLLRAIARNTTLSRLPADACCAPSHWLVPPARLAEQYPHVPEALSNTRRIAETCHTDWDFKETIFPAFRQWTDQQAFTTLREKTYAGALWRYGMLSDEVKGRIEHELRIIRELTNGYVPPKDGCTTYAVCLAELDRFERDLHHHVHLENNVLFPKAIALEA